MTCFPGTFLPATDWVHANPECEVCGPGGRPGLSIGGDGWTLTDTLTPGDDPPPPHKHHHQPHHQPNNQNCEHTYLCLVAIPRSLERAQRR